MQPAVFNATSLNQPLRLSTADLPTWQRREWLCEVIGREYANVEITAPKRGDLYNDMTIYSSEAMRLSIVHSNAITIQRLPQSPALASQDAYFAVVLLSGEYALEQHNREVFLKPGQMTLYDATRPHRIYCPSHFSKLIIALPRQQLRARLAGVEHCTALPILSEHGAGAVASSFIQSLARQASGLSCHSFNTLSESAIDVLTLALNEVRPQAYQLSRSRSFSLFRVKEFVAQQLSHPQLSTAMIEAGTGLSARYIHALFQPEQTSLMRYVWDARLTQCHRDLLNPALANQRISDIALRWGFNDFAHFSRAFKQKYGASPRQLRAQSLDRAYARD